MNIFSYCHFHDASRECFWSKKISNLVHRFKIAILEIFQNGTFERIHEITLLYLLCGLTGAWALLKTA